MNITEYKSAVKMLNKKQPKKETPKDQKFSIGEIVKISKPGSWFSKDSFDEDSERIFKIEYSYFKNMEEIRKLKLKNIH